MTVALLALIALILLFGAGAVKGWIKGLVLWLVGAVLLAGVIGVATSVFGEDAFIWLLAIALAVVIGIWIWVSSYNETEAAHKDRVKRAKAQRDERRARGIKWP